MLDLSLVLPSVTRTLSHRSFFFFVVVAVTVVCLTQLQKFPASIINMILYSAFYLYTLS